MIRYACDPEAVIRELQAFADEGEILNARIYIAFSTEIETERTETIGLDEPDWLSPRAEAGPVGRGA